MSFTALDMLRDGVPQSELKYGWRVEISPSGNIALNFTVLNFDWKSIGDICDESVNALFDSPTFKGMMAKLSSEKEKLGGQSYFEASSISELGEILADAGIKVELDKIVRKTIRRKSAEIVARNGGKRRARKTPR